MQPSVSPCSTPYSVFDAIKDGDWEGLLALYVKTASDAVHSAEFASRGGGIDLRTLHQLSDIPTRGVFHEGEESISSINAHCFKLIFFFPHHVLSQKRKVKSIIILVLPHTASSRHRMTPFHRLLMNLINCFVK